MSFAHCTTAGDPVTVTSRLEGWVGENHGSKRNSGGDGGNEETG